MDKLRIGNWLPPAAFLAVLFCSTQARDALAAPSGCTPAAHVFCVTNTNDTTDTNSPNYAGSLRKAMNDANAATLAPNTIGFQIGGSGVHTINLVAPPPAISVDLTIDGFSQPGSVLNTNVPDQGGLTSQLSIEIVGFSGNNTGFYYTTGSFRTLTFQGLVLHGFNDAISGQQNFLTPKALINVYGCYIGTKPDGTAFATNGNAGSAVRLGYDNGHIGGTLAWQRNLLSGNGGAGVLSGTFDATSSVVIEGNLIGTDASATSAIANGTASNWPGIYLSGGNARNTRIGCTGVGCATAASRNVISGNHDSGIGLLPGPGTPYTALEIKGNYIGVGWNGAALPNGYADPASRKSGGGIKIIGNSDPTPAIIGGFGDGEANVIAFNYGPGINVTEFFSSGTTYFDSRANQVHDNAWPGLANIAIAAVNGDPLANDAGDADTGNNDRQNSPDILTAVPSRGPGPGQLQMQVTYRVTSAPANSTYPIRVDFYFSANGGAGQWLGSDSYPSSAGQAFVSLPAPITLPVAAGTPWYAAWRPIVAIATNAGGHSSEISAANNDWIYADGFEAAP